MSPAPDRNQIDAQIGRRIRELRAGRQLSADDLAQALGLSLEHYLQREDGRGRFSAEQLFQLARQLEVKMADIFGGSITGPR